jgi:uncharacterized repeat protein (TIGR01451 family)
MGCLNLERHRRGNLCLSGSVAGLIMFLAASGQAVEIGLNPLMGDGAAGRQTIISGSSFPPNTTLNVTVGGYATSPGSVVSDVSGDIQPTTLLLPALSAGSHDFVLADISMSYIFTGAYRVGRNICLTPASGDGRAGQTSDTNGAIPPGGWDGMVFQLEGWGFAPNTTISADSITVGGAGTTHAAILTDSTGGLPTTTVIVTSNLALGRKDIVIDDGALVTFPGVYEVRRSLGLNPASGSRNALTVINVSGWGFEDGTILANTIRVGGFAATHGTAAISDGAFSVDVTLQVRISTGANDIDTGQENFVGVYHGSAGGAVITAIYPVVLDGLPNRAFRVRGIGNWGNGTIQADSILVRHGGGEDISGSSHPAITVAGDVFPETWVRLNGGQERATDRFSIYVPSKLAVQDFRCLEIKQTIGLCPVNGDGRPGFSATLTGFGFEGGAAMAADSITIGGLAVTHAAAQVGLPSGVIDPLVLTAPALPNGDLDIVVDDGPGATFGGLFHSCRSIGLSRICGPGTFGATTRLLGCGFSGSSVIDANTIEFGSVPTTHPAISVGADGTFAATDISLGTLDSGSHDIDAQELFAQSYRVYAPVVEMSKYRNPPTGVTGTIVTFSMSFTNTGKIGKPRALDVVLHDSIPAGMLYSAASATSTLPAVIEWYDGAWQSVEPAPASVQAVRWSLSSPLPSGASGYAFFDVAVQ